MWHQVAVKLHLSHPHLFKQGFYLCILLQTVATNKSVKFSYFIVSLPLKGSIKFYLKSLRILWTVQLNEILEKTLSYTLQK